MGGVGVIGDSAFQVSWFPKDAIEAYMREHEMEFTDAALQCEHTKSFEDIEVARRFARSVLESDAYGEVAIYPIVRVTTDPQDGGPMLVDWERVGEQEYIS